MSGRWRYMYRYTLRVRNRIVYFGITQDPERRAYQHEREGKPGKMRIQGRKVSLKTAEDSERRKIDAYQKRNGPDTLLNKALRCGESMSKRDWYFVGGFLGVVAVIVVLFNNESEPETAPPTRTPIATPLPTSDISQEAIDEFLATPSEEGAMMFGFLKEATWGLLGLRLPDSSFRMPLLGTARTWRLNLSMSESLASRCLPTAEARASKP